MADLKEVLESAGLPAQRGVYTGESKPAAYYTFLRIMANALVETEDMNTAKESKEMYRVTLFHKEDFEKQLQNTLEKLKAAGYYINSVDAENYETDTGYWVVPITIQILREKEI